MRELDQKSEETIFSGALHCAPAERARFLDQACAGQPALRRKIEQLLEAQPELGEFMEGPADIRTPGPERTIPLIVPTEEKPGSMIGCYKLLQKIGEGGCGVVYMAEQEEPVRRRVALKVIKLGMDTKSVIARFEAERQALAMMDHPNIAKVLDAGATQTGRPYFAMELVRGVKVTQFCDQSRLPTRARLDLFIQVCQAVQHAHQKGIIHRDLKPSNILVTIHDPGAAPVPKVIDFGIAKATQGRLTDQTLFTAFEQFLGTPAYMSPEQAMMTALDIDTRSDIYSLGVLLYELLTGHTPFDTKELLADGFEEMRRTIREKEPLHPSIRLSTLLEAEQTTAASLRQTEPPKLVHLVRGDLDWIVMKALEKDRARRYETASALAADLQRHLNNEPVLARPPSRLYEFQKTLRRHKVGFAAAATVMIALTAGVLVSSLAAMRAGRAEMKAERAGYIADMDLANRALGEGDLGMAQTLLRRYWPRPLEAKKPDLRNWEWRYLANLADGDPHVSLVAHSSWVSSFGFLDNNTLLTAGKADWRAVVWNVKERRPSIIITNVAAGGSFSDVTAVSLKRNAMFYRAAWRRSSSVTIVDLRNNGESNPSDPKQVLLDADASIVSLDLSPDESVLAAAFGDQVGLWDLDQKTWLQPFESESGLATQGLFSPDGRMLVVADEGGYIAFWKLAERRKLGVLKNACGHPGVLRFSRDGQWLVIPGRRSPTQVWNTEDRTLVAELSDSISAERAVFSSDGRWLAIVGSDPTVRLWETSGWRKARTLRGHTAPISAVDFSPNTHLLATGARNGEVKLWSLEEPATALEKVSLPAAEYFEVAAEGSGFGRIVKSQPSDGPAWWTAELWSASPLQRVFTMALQGPPSSGVVLASGRGAVLGGYDGSIRVIGPIVGNELILSNAHKGEVYLMDVSLDGSTLATKGMKDGGAPADKVCIWRLPYLEPIAQLPQFDNVHGIKLSADGKRLAGFTGPGDMGVWEIPLMKGPPMWRGLATLQEVKACAFSPDNRWLAAVTFDDGGAFLWDLATHRRRALPRALSEYNSISFSPDGSRLAAGSEGESRIFDSATGQAVLSLRFPGLKLAFARDGERILAVHAKGASVFRAPRFEKLQFAWLKEEPSGEPPPYRGPNPNYVRPDRPQSAGDH